MPCWVYWNEDQSAVMARLERIPPAGLKDAFVSLGTTLGQRAYRFENLREVMARATPLRSGDCLAGVAAATEQERVAARWVLADVPLSAFLSEALIPYEDDEVTRLIIDSHDALAFAPAASLTVGGFRDRSEERRVGKECRSRW